MESKIKPKNRFFAVCEHCCQEINMHDSESSCDVCKTINENKSSWAEIIEQEHKKNNIVFKDIKAGKNNFES